MNHLDTGRNVQMMMNGKAIWWILASMLIYQHKRLLLVVSSRTAATRSHSIYPDYRTPVICIYILYDHVLVSDHMIGKGYVWELRLAYLYSLRHEMHNLFNEMFFEMTRISIEIKVPHPHIEFCGEIITTHILTNCCNNYKYFKYTRNTHLSYQPDVKSGNVQNELWWMKNQVVEICFSADLSSCLAQGTLPVGTQPA